MFNHANNVYVRNFLYNNSIDKQLSFIERSTELPACFKQYGSNRGSFGLTSGVVFKDIHPVLCSMMEKCI